MIDAENLDRPVEVEAELDDKLFTEGFGLPNEEVKEDVVEQTPVDTEVDTPVENEQKEVDFTPFLEKLSKEVK